MAVFLLSEVLEHFSQVPEATLGSLRLNMESQLRTLGFSQDWMIHAPYIEDAAQPRGAAKRVCIRVEPDQHCGRWSKGSLPARAPRIEICLRAHQSKLGKCSQCLFPAPGYDRLAERCFQFVPLWGMTTWFVYAPRRWVCSVWHSRGVSAMGFGQAPSYAELRLVPRQLGQTAELAGGIPTLPDQLGERISLRRDGGGLGPRTDGSHRYFGPGRR